MELNGYQAGIGDTVGEANTQCALSHELQENKMEHWSSRQGSELFGLGQKDSPGARRIRSLPIHIYRVDVVKASFPTRGEPRLDGKRRVSGRGMEVLSTCHSLYGKAEYGEAGY